MTWAYLAFTFVVYMLFMYGVIKMQDDERQDWRAERRELLNRIQRPEQLPPLERGAFTVPELPDDEWSRVGTIVNDPEAYLGGEESA